nr:hypothetical protein [Candidatus Njordarchaeota archaeon]
MAFIVKKVKIAENMIEVAIGAKNDVEWSARLFFLDEVCDNGVLRLTTPF